MNITTRHQIHIGTTFYYCANLVYKCLFDPKCVTSYKRFAGRRHLLTHPAAAGNGADWAMMRSLARRARSLD